MQLTWNPPLNQHPLQSRDKAAAYPPRFLTAAKDLVLGYLLLGGLLELNLSLPETLSLSVRFAVMLCSGVGVSILIHYFFLFIHEAGHSHLFPAKVGNDRLANLLIAYWFFLDVRQYRRMHWDHHLKHGTVDDPEDSYFRPLSWRNIFLALTGFMAVDKLLSWKSQASKGDDRSAGKVSARLLHFFAYQTAIFLLFVWRGSYLAYFLVWICPWMCGFPFLAFVRQVCEHRKPAAGSVVFTETDHGPYTRVFRSSFLSRFLGAAGFRQHWYHHFNPHIPYSRLDNFAKEVGSNPKFIDIPQETTYIRTLIGLVRDAQVSAKPNTP